MDKKPVYEELEKRVNELEEEAVLRKAAEQALRESEERYHTIFELAADSIVLIDGETGELVEFNKSAHENLGYTHEEFKKLKIPDFEILEDADDVAQHIRKIIKEGFDSFETKHRTKSGEIRDIQVSSRAICIRGNNFVQSIWRDITEHKRAEEALRQSDQKYRNIFNNAQVGLFRSRVSDGKILECNERFAHMFGYENREHCIAEFVTSKHYLDPGTRERMLAKMHETDEIRNFEARLSRQNASTIWVRAFARVYPEEGYLEGVVADITEERLAMEALRESEERYRRITDAVTDYIYTVKIQDGRPVETTHGSACVAVTGYSAEDFKGNQYLWIQMVHEEDRKAVEEQARQTLLGQKVVPLEHRIVRKDGAIRWVKNTPVPNFDGQGRLLSYDGLIQDITERKQADEALCKANEKLYTFSQQLGKMVEERTAELKEKSNQLIKAERLAAVGKMADKIAHECRNSLTVVGGFARRMNEKTPDDDPNKKYLRIIVGEVMLLEDKVSEIIKMGKEK